MGVQESEGDNKNTEGSQSAWDNFANARFRTLGTGNSKQPGSDTSELWIATLPGLGEAEVIYSLDDEVKKA